MTKIAPTRLDAALPIATLEPLRRVNAALLELIDEFCDEDWTRPTIHRDRTVKDLTAHLLHGSIRRISSLRDGYRLPPSRAISDADDLIGLIQDDNRQFMTAMSGVSPQIIRELVARYDGELVRQFEDLNPDALGLGVVWAGEWRSANWFDIAREYTEKWHHQQQLRDATGRPPLYDPSLLLPAIETFARGLPHAYRNLHASEGMTIAISVGAPAEIGWTLQRERGAWSLWRGADPNAQTAITASPDLLWRVWTKGLSPAQAKPHLTVSGSADHAEPLLGFVAIMA
jgi:uncharacterized protein (TIGR03083 family)